MKNKVLGKGQRNWGLLNAVNATATPFGQAAQEAQILLLIVHFSGTDIMSLIHPEPLPTYSILVVVVVLIVREGFRERGKKSE